MQLTNTFAAPYDKQCFCLLRRPDDIGLMPRNEPSSTVVSDNACCLLLPPIPDAFPSASYLAQMSFRSVASSLEAVYWLSLNSTFRFMRTQLPLMLAVVFVFSNLKSFSDTFEYK